jgi:hypothetical protein
MTGKKPFGLFYFGVLHVTGIVKWKILATHCNRLCLKFDGTRAETRFRFSAKRTGPFKSTGASVQSTTGSRGVRISGTSGSNFGYTMFRGSVKGTGYPLHSPVSPSLSLPCVIVCHHISTGLYIPFNDAGCLRSRLLLSAHHSRPQGLGPFPIEQPTSDGCIHTSRYVINIGVLINDL